MLLKALLWIAAVLGIGGLAWLMTHDWVLAVVSMGLPAEMVLEAAATQPLSYRSYLRAATPADEAVPLS